MGAALILDCGAPFIALRQTKPRVDNRLGDSSSATMPMISLRVSTA